MWCDLAAPPTLAELHLITDYLVGLTYQLSGHNTKIKTNLHSSPEAISIRMTSALNIVDPNLSVGQAKSSIPWVFQLRAR